MHVTLSPSEWQNFLDNLYERNERLEIKEPAQQYTKDEQVDSYVLSAHVEALQSTEIDGDLWGTLDDIEIDAKDETEAWAKICHFYLERECVLISVEPCNTSGNSEVEEWIMSRPLWERLKRALNSCP